MGAGGLLSDAVVNDRTCCVVTGHCRHVPPLCRQLRTWPGGLLAGDAGVLGEEALLRPSQVGSASAGCLAADVVKVCGPLQDRGGRRFPTEVGLVSVPGAISGPECTPWCLHGCCSAPPAPRSLRLCLPLL